jgi:hypothetical protein
MHKGMRRKLGIAAVVTAFATLGLAGSASAQAPSNPITMNPGSLNFGSQTVGTTSAAQSVNLGVPCHFVLDLRPWGGVSCTAPGNIQAIEVTGDFTQVNDCPLPISNSSVDGTIINCNISVAFAPGTTGERTGELRFTSYGQAGAYVVPLTGTGALTPSGGVPGQPGNTGNGNGSKGANGSGNAAGLTAKKCKKSKKGKAAKKCKQGKKRR